ncbi:MAG: endolytic transglycosylase MltG [Deltaproteobacteria bacterium]|nr:endolytic transglycosylase MltG [Deltaproteobacteria bacterium]MCB9785170.1 endolytic transglycosylase MltG [Deltaproteobacteria bacterium]
MARKRRARRPPRRWGRWLALGALVVTLAAAGFVWRVLTARPAHDAAPVTVEVPRGASGRAVVELLAARGLVEQPDLAWLALSALGGLGKVEAGRHVLPGNPTLLELAKLLRRPASVAQVTLTLVPGESVWQAAQRVEAAGLGTRAELLALAADPVLARDLLKLPVGAARPPRADGVQPTWLEGFLYPETYFFAPDAGARAVVDRTTAMFRKVWERLKTRRRSDVLAIRDRYGLSDADLVTLASLVEEETKAQEEAPTIAGVFYNRLARSMPLQTDPTLVYRPDRVGRPPTPTDRRDATNPYNTYAHSGLPPGPICSPGARALEAVLAPERHDWLYFVARRDARGTHAFARTLAEHEANIRRYLRAPRDAP